MVAAWPSVMTRAPICLASWIAKPATPPAPPCMRMVSPGFSLMVSSIDTSAVRAGQREGSGFDMWRDCLV